MGDGGNAVDERVVIHDAHRADVMTGRGHADELANGYDGAYDGIGTIRGERLLDRGVDVDGADLAHLDRMARITRLQGDRRGDAAFDALDEQGAQLVGRHSGYVDLAIEHRCLGHVLGAGFLGRGKRDAAAPEDNEHGDGKDDEGLSGGTHLLLGLLRVLGPGSGFVRRLRIGLLRAVFRIVLASVSRDGVHRGCGSDLLGVLENRAFRATFGHSHSALTTNQVR